MSTIIDDTPDRSEPATEAQLWRIGQLLESRWVSRPMASKWIAELMDQPELGNTGGGNKDINQQVKDRIEREP